MLIECDAIVTYMGELWEAAMRDHRDADPGDVGLNGVSIKEWRAAYLEGIKDCWEGVMTRVPETQREEVKVALYAAFEAARTNHDPATPLQPST